MKYIVTINAKHYEVDVEKGEATIVGTTGIGLGKLEPIEAVKPVAKPQAIHTNVGGDLLLSPMPGSIIAIKVNEGDIVKKGDILFILEAMKMENDIMADKDGTVAKIMVAKNALVATNDALAMIE